MSEGKETALDILFYEIKISKSFMPDHLFKWLEIVYGKAKEIEKNQIKDSYDKGHGAGISDYHDIEWGFEQESLSAEQYYNETYGEAEPKR